MQICENCKLAAATIAITTIHFNSKKTRHYCENCCHMRCDEWFPGNEGYAGWQTIFNPAVVASNPSPMPDKHHLVCDKCGITWHEFAESGRLGCDNDVAVFREVLRPLLLRLHGSSKYDGLRKPPVCKETQNQAQVRISSLMANLGKAIDAEQYEEAAVIRDLLRQGDSGPDVDTQ